MGTSRLLHEQYIGKPIRDIKFALTHALNREQDLISQLNTSKLHLVRRNGTRLLVLPFPVWFL